MAASPSYYALLWRARTRLNDSLDVVAAHGLGGTVGALLTGVLADRAWNGVADGLLFGQPRQLAVQALAVSVAAAWSAALTWALLRAIALFVPLRAESRDEALGLDVTQHGEEAYAQGEGALLLLPPLSTPAAPVSAIAVAEGGRHEASRGDRASREADRRARALYRAEVRGLTLQRVQGHGGERPFALWQSIPSAAGNLGSGYPTSPTGIALPKPLNLKDGKITVTIYRKGVDGR